MKKYLILCFIVLMPQAAICGIESTTGSFVDSQSVSLIGTQLGVKPAPTPLYFSTFEDDIVGQLPSGFVNPNPTYGGYVQSNEAIGSKSVEFNYNTTSQEQGSRDSIDFGDAPRNPEFYISTWMYYDKTDTTSTQWQIKTIVLGSDDSVYFYFSNNLNQTSLGLQQWWRESNGGQWFNNFASMWYNGVGDQGADGGTLASDAFPFNEWHRVDIWAKMSSAPLQPDAIMKVARKNKVTPLCDITDGVSHDTNNDLWRGIGIGQLVASNFDGLLKLDVLYDNLYIDRTPQRVEICNSSTFDLANVCETQPQTSWSETEIDITINRGIFSEGDSAYIVLIDDTNTQVGTGYQITFTAGTAPTNVISTTDGQTVSNPSFTIQGTATATTGRTISGVTIPGETVTPDDGVWDEQVEAWTSNVILPEGLSSYTATASDGTETGPDSINATYTPVVSTISTNASNSAGCMIR